jgi:hypothetical protein
MYPMFSLRPLRVLCVAAVWFEAEALTAETQRTRRGRRELQAIAIRYNASTWNMEPETWNMELET